MTQIESNTSREVLSKTENFVRGLLESKACGHDFWHIHRVRKLALRIAPEVGADSYLVEMAALLHDVADPKLHDSPVVGLEILQRFLDSCGLNPSLRSPLEEILARISFGGELEGKNPEPKSPELQAVQDADRLDALGAIGIARTFAYGGSRGHAMHDPAILVREKLDQATYRNGKTTSVNHFHEKLFKLKDQMNTKMGRAMAEERHRLMLNYLAAFQAEWEV